MCTRHLALEAYRKVPQQPDDQRVCILQQPARVYARYLDMVVNKSGFNSSFSDREKVAMRMSEICSWGSSRDQRNARVHYHEHAKTRCCNDIIHPGASTKLPEIRNPEGPWWLK
jgi:hypothetical protein